MGFYVKYERRPNGSMCCYSQHCKHASLAADGSDGNGLQLEKPVVLLRKGMDVTFLLLSHPWSYNRTNSCSQSTQSECSIRLSLKHLAVYKPSVSYLSLKYKSL